MKQITYKILFQSILIIISMIHLTSYAGAPATSLAPMIEKTSPSVVNVRAQIKVSDLETYLRLQKERQLSGNKNLPIPKKVVSVGSGVIIDANKGYIVTNAHVVDDAQAVTVTLHDGRHFNAKLIGLDKPSDIALLQIQAKDLTAITISDSNNLKVGDVVIAIGNPFGLNQSVTAGIVSALGRTSLGIENYENFIQTDTSINPGNSGGALINTEGHLVGINTAILGTQGSIGIGFAIPSNMAVSVAKQLIQYGNVQRGALGVFAQDITPELISALKLTVNKGAMVSLVMPNSPAEQAGLQSGDIITAINGTSIKNANDVINSIAFMRVDSKANITVIRNNKSLTLDTTISDPKKRKILNEKSNPFLYGVGLKNLSVVSPLHGPTTGVLVLSIEEDSNAWHANLLPGDLIISANQQKVSDIKTLMEIASKSNQQLVLNVLRQSGGLFLIINKEQ